MKIAILMPLATQRGGAEQLLSALMRHRRRPGVSWIVIFLEDGPMRRQFDALGVATHVVETGRLRHVGAYMRAVRQIRAVLKEEHVDLVFSWMAKAHVYGAVAAWRAGVPAMWYQHGVPAASDGLTRLATLLPARGLLACSRAAAAAQRRFWPRRPVRVVHPCADLQRFDPDRLPTPAEARRRLGLPAGGPVVGIVGRLQRWKGIHVLLEALPLIRARHPGTCCVVVGGRHDLEPDYEAFLQTRIRALGIEQHVRMAGFQEDVPLWMQAMDVVVHASDHEPFGMVIIEAMALGKPIVAGASGGPCEIIEEGRNGLLAPYDDAEALARQVLSLLDAPRYRQSVARAARARAQAFAPEHFAERFVEAVRHVGGRPPAGARGAEAQHMKESDVLKQTSEVDA